MEWSNVQGGDADGPMSPAQLASEPGHASMPSAPASADSFPAWSRLASGIEAGTVGGLAMFALLLCESTWDGHVWWEFPNLLGSTFYGPRSFRSGPGLATLAGLALHFVITGSLGALFGLAFGRIRQRGRLLALGLLAAIGWYNLANLALWPAVNPWVPVTSPRPVTMLSHVLLGVCLGFMGQRQMGQRQLLSAPPGQPGAIFDPPRFSISPEEMPLPNAQIAAHPEIAPHTQVGPGPGLPPEPEPAAESQLTFETQPGPAPPPAVASSDALE